LRSRFYFSYKLFLPLYHTWPVSLLLYSLLLIKAARVAGRSAVLQSQSSVLPFCDLSRPILPTNPTRPLPPCLSSPPILFLPVAASPAATVHRRLFFLTSLPLQLQLVSLLASRRVSLPVSPSSAWGTSKYLSAPCPLSLSASPRVSTPHFDSPPRSTLPATMTKASRS
jgi:hypothetical protein